MSVAEESVSVRLDNKQLYRLNLFLTTSVVTVNGAKFHVFDVQPQIDAYRSLVEGALERPLKWESDDLTLQNIQAPCLSEHLINLFIFYNIFFYTNITETKYK